MRAHLLLTALLLSAHLFHTQARLAQGRRHAGGERGRVEAVPEAYADTLPDVWDRRRLMQGGTSPPTPLSGGAIAAISVASFLALAGIIGGVVYKAKKKKGQSAERKVQKGVDAGVAKVQADKARGTKAERDLARRRAEALSLGNLLFGPVDSFKVFAEKVDVEVKKRAPLPDGITAAEVKAEVRAQADDAIVVESEAKNSYREVAPNYLDAPDADFPNLLLEGESFVVTEPDERAVNQKWAPELLMEFEDERNSPEAKLLEKKVTELTEQIKELQRQENQKNLEMQAAADKYNNAADDKARKEALKELEEKQKEKQAIQDEKESKSKERSEAMREGHRG